MEGKVAPLGSSPTFSDSSSYGLTLANKQVVLCLLPTVLLIKTEVASMKQSHGKAVSRRLSRVRVPYASISRKAGARFETP